MRVEKDLDAGMQCIKYMIFVTNFLFLMVGFLLISIGTTVVAVYSDFDGFLDEYYFSPAKLTTAIGVIILFVSLFGCVGALKESTCLINLFAVALFLVLILEYSAAIAAYAARRSIESSIEDSMQSMMKTYYPNTDDKDVSASERKNAKYTWDSTQEILRCCGIHNSSDWMNYGAIPDSCINPKKEGGRTPYYYEDSCLDWLSYIASEFSLLIAIGCLCISIIQVLGIVFAQMLAKAIRKLKTQILVRRQENRKFYEQLAYGDLGEKKPVEQVVYTPQQSDA